MKCSCCGKNKGFFESFAPLDDGLSICIKCDTVLCRIKDAKKYSDLAQYDENVGIVRANIKKAKNVVFSKWFEEYLKKVGQPTTSPQSSAEKKTAT